MAKKFEPELFQDPIVSRPDSAGAFANFVGKLKPDSEVILSPHSFKQMHIYPIMIEELVNEGVLTPEGDRYIVNYNAAAELTAKVLGASETEAQAKATISGAWELLNSFDNARVTGKKGKANNSDDEHPLVSHDAEFEAWGFHIENFG